MADVEYCPNCKAPIIEYQTILEGGDEAWDNETHRRITSHYWFVLAAICLEVGAPEGCEFKDLPAFIKEKCVKDKRGTE